MPDFYLTSRDSSELNARPRACKVIGRRDESTGGSLEVEVTPPLPRAIFRSREAEVKVVTLAPRRRGESLLDIKNWPVDVYVLERAPRRSVAGGRTDVEGDSILAWGELFPTEDQARRAYYAPLHKPQSAWPKPGDYSESDDPWREMR
jgi:hypothetical protein